MPSQLVLVTGASGHIGFRVLVLALQAGYQVRATVRSESQIKKLSNTASIKPYANKVEFVVVKEKFDAPDAFREALEGVTDVIHVASPIPSAESIPVNGDKPNWTEIFYNPARNGTLSLLRTASNIESIRRVVITSSAIVLERSDKPVDAYTIAKHPTHEEAEAAEGPFPAYIISKILSHHAATDFVKENKVNFDLVRVLPGYVAGANELVETAEGLNTGSNGAFLATFTGQIDPNPKLKAQVLLEDVAKAHVLALDPKIAPNLTNFVVVGNGGAGFAWDELAETVERLYPEEVKSGLLKPSKGQVDLDWPIDTNSSEKALGFKFAGREEIVKSLADQFLALAGK